MDDIILKDCTSFQWDSGNLDKNRKKHGVSRFECEQIFFNEPLLIHEDIKHSQEEKRLPALGKTDAGRMIFAIFTLRHHLIRIISARDMSKKERKFYESCYPTLSIRLTAFVNSHY